MALGVPEFRRALIQLGGALDGDIGKLIAAVGRLDLPDALRLVTDAYPELSSPYLAAAADLTATWYEDQPADGAEAAEFIAEPAPLPTVEQLAVNARWALTEKNPTTALLGAGRRQLFQQHRDTVLLNAEREGVAWAREARPGACGFCRMTATRILTEGFGGAPGLYRSEESATANPHTVDAKGHDWCRCVAVPIRRGQEYTIPGYVHDWLGDYEAVSRDESGRLLPAWKIADNMEKRAAERGEPVSEATDDRDRRPTPPAPTVIDLDQPAGKSGATSPPKSKPADQPGSPTGPIAGQLAIEAPQRQRALNRPPQPIALPAARTLLMLTAAPSRPAVPTPDPGAIAEWLDAEDDHRHALDYWRRVDAEDLHSLPADEKIPDPPAPAERVVPPPEPPAALATPDPDPVVDVRADDHAGETPLNRAIREFEEALATGDDDAIERAADAMERAELAEIAERERAEKLAAKTAQQRARREAARDAELEAIGQLVEQGEDPEFAEVAVLIRRPEWQKRIDAELAKSRNIVTQDGRTPREAVQKEFENQLLEQIRRREFMRQARADGHRGKGFDDLVDSVFRQRVDELYFEAEDATNGYMVKRRFEGKFHPKKLWYVNEATARKYMSEEMAQWFDENGRITRPVFRQMILDGSTNWSKYTKRTGDFNA